MKDKKLKLSDDQYTYSNFLQINRLMMYLFYGKWNSGKTTSEHFLSRKK